MEKIKGQYIFDKASWKVRYKVEDGDEQHYEQVMLHPNNVQHAKENKTDWFVIRESPNLYNGGSWEPMAIVVPSDKIEDVAEQIKGKELFKGLNEHAMSVLTEVDGIPEPKPKDDVVSSFNEWQRKDIKRLKKLNMNEKKTFYRVCHKDTLQGLWYDYTGNFTGLIHEDFNFCANNELRMDFDPEIVGWLSATETLEDLWRWFTQEDIQKLQDHGWFIHEFEAVDYRLYERFQHIVIKQDTSVVTKLITLNDMNSVNFKLEMTK